MVKRILLLFPVVVGLIVGAFFIGRWSVVRYLSSEEAAVIHNPPPEESVVKRVLDPITIQLETGHVVRYIGVRTPEVKEEVQCFGKEALLANESVIGKKVRMEGEPLIDRSQDGAWIRYVYLLPESSPTPTETEKPDEEESEEADDQVEEEPEEIFINERMLEGGFAFPVVSEDMKYGQRLLGAARFARATAKGLWGECKIEEKTTPQGAQAYTQPLTQCVIKGTVNTEGKKIYRTPECTAYEQTIVLQSEGGAWLCSEDVARGSGYTKANDCAK